MSLATPSGRRLSTTLGQVKSAPAPHFSHEALRKLQIKLRCPDRQMRVVDHFLRIHAGRNSVEPHHRDDLVEKNNRLKTFFSHERIMMTEYYSADADDAGKKKKKKEKRQVEVPVAYCNDVEALAMEVMLERGLEAEETITQLGLDDGEFCCTFFSTYISIFRPRLV